MSNIIVVLFFFFQAEDGIRDFCLSRGLGDVYKRQALADKPQEEQTILEFYYRARLIQDYISGMTDHYAYEEFRRFSVCQ